MPKKPTKPQQSPPGEEVEDKAEDIYSMSIAPDGETTIVTPSGASLTLNPQAAADLCDSLLNAFMVTITVHPAWGRTPMHLETDVTPPSQPS